MLAQISSDVVLKILENNPTAGFFLICVVLGATGLLSLLRFSFNSLKELKSQMVEFHDGVQELRQQKDELQSKYMTLSLSHQGLESECANLKEAKIALSKEIEQLKANL